ncbi:MAG: polyphosphate kinase 1, partial [Bacteroidota bacterium]|nr:polyphosphate kinase 1 [Bacteroidota bacterium]
EKVMAHRLLFESTYHGLLQELAEKHVHIINEKQLTDTQGAYVRWYFREKVRHALVPVMLEEAPVFPMLRDKIIYLAICLSSSNKKIKSRYSLIELPTDVLPRFLVLPSGDEASHVMLLDDVVRYSLPEVFSIFEYDKFEAFTIKVTRDAELDMDEDVSENLLQKLSKSLKQRKKGRPVRFIYDERMPQDLLKFLLQKLKLNKGDNVIPGGRYHNFKDFINFPRIGNRSLWYEGRPPLPHKDITPYHSLLKLIIDRDVMLHYPYQSFNHLLDLLREAAIDPHVTSVKITLYRLAANSNVINALVNAVRNGKSVTAVMELQARFDEEANIQWANTLREEGAKVIFSTPGMKVHAKLCLITRKSKGKTTRIVHVGTGNFNEATAHIYSDTALFTAHQGIAEEVQQVFTLFENPFKVYNFKHLLLSPYFMRNHLIKLVEKEIAFARAGKKGHIILKLNNLVDTQMVEKLYEAGRAGVKVQLIIRGICSVVPGVLGVSDNIEAISIVDKYLEHARILWFYNDGKEKIYLTSADWMSRNLDYRIEVACPVLDADMRSELKAFLDLQWADNTKARVFDAEQTNQYRENTGLPVARAQEDFYDYLKEMAEKARGEALSEGSWQV